jgi:hypothetical protein
MGAALRGPLDEPCAPVKLRTPPCGRNRFRSWHDSHPKPARRGSRLDHPFIIGLLLGGTSLFRQAVVPQARPSLRLACYRLRMPVRTMIALLLTGTLALPSCARSQRAAIAPRGTDRARRSPSNSCVPRAQGRSRPSSCCTAARASVAERDTPGTGFDDSWPWDMPWPSPIASRRAAIRMACAAMGFWCLRRCACGGRVRRRAISRGQSRHRLRPNWHDRLLPRRLDRLGRARPRGRSVGAPRPGPSTGSPRPLHSIRSAATAPGSRPIARPRLS